MINTLHVNTSITLTTTTTTVPLEPIPTVTADNPYAVKRPKATDSMLERQYSFRGFDKLSETSPFKRQVRSSLVVWHCLRNSPYVCLF